MTRTETLTVLQSLYEPTCPSNSSLRKAVSFSKQLEKVRYFRKEDPAINVRTQKELMKESNPIFSIRSPACRFKTIHEIASKVQAENLAMDTLTLKYPFLEGYVFVRNISFHKRVVVRYTPDNWASWFEVDAKFDSSNAVHGMDRFMFVMDASRFFSSNSNGNLQVPTSDSLQFAVRFECEGQAYWDSNGGSNYRVDFITQTSTSCPTSVPPPTTVTAPLAPALVQTRSPSPPPPPPPSSPSSSSDSSPSSSSPSSPSSSPVNTSSSNSSSSSFSSPSPSSLSLDQTKVPKLSKIGCSLLTISDAAKKSIEIGPVSPPLKVIRNQWEQLALGELNDRYNTLYLESNIRALENYPVHLPPSLRDGYLSRGSSPALSVSY